MKFVYFLDKKLTSFYFFLRCEPEWRFYFLSSDMGKKTFVGARRPNNMLSVALWQTMLTEDQTKQSHLTPSSHTVNYRKLISLAIRGTP